MKKIKISNWLVDGAGTSGDKNFLSDYPEDDKDENPVEPAKELCE